MVSFKNTKFWPPFCFFNVNLFVYIFFIDSENFLWILNCMLEHSRFNSKSIMIIYLPWESTFLWIQCFSISIWVRGCVWCCVNWGNFLNFQIFWTPFWTWLKLWTYENYVDQNKKCNFHKGSNMNSTFHWYPKYSCLQSKTAVKIFF